jgi:uncharacterized protein YjbI with pentapeptide repeats
VVPDRSRASSTPGVSLNGGRLAGDTGHARWRLRALALASVGALVALGGALAPLAPAQQSQEQEISLLFVQTANRGTMKPIPGPTPRFNLRLRGVSPQVVWFSDRPARQSGHIRAPEFTRAWAGFGFVDVPPNAALTLLHAGDRQDTVVMELGGPHYRKKKNAIRYSARLLDEATGNLSHLNSDLDPRVNRRFRSPSLFIDDATARVVGTCRIAPFTRCSEADLSGADLTLEDLHGASLFGADMRETTLWGTNLSGAYLVSAVLVRAVGGAYLRDANIGLANLNGAKLPVSQFQDASLVGASMIGADLSSSKLGRAQLGFANLSGGNLTGSDLSSANVDNTNLSGATLRDTGLSDATLRQVDLTGANLIRAILIRAILTGANLSDANLTRANLRLATLRETNLSSADLTGANLTGANLTGANLTGANLTGANLTGANLTGAGLCDTRMPNGNTNSRDCPD